jgi:hypothetical protein
MKNLFRISGFIALVSLLIVATVSAADGYIQINNGNPVRGQVGQPTQLVFQLGNTGVTTLEDVRVNCVFRGRAGDTGEPAAFSPRFTQFHGLPGSVSENQVRTSEFDIPVGQNYNIQIGVVPPDSDDLRIRCRLIQDPPGPVDIEVLDGVDVQIIVQ